MDPKEARAEMERGYGTRFDPQILGIFLDNVG